MKEWLGALRPKTLPAAAVPVIVGTAFAASIGAAAWAPALAALVASLLLQVGTNLANDHYDHVKGADPPERAGPTRASASGLIDPEHVRTAAFVSFGLAALVGLYLVWIGGWPILIIGLAGIASGILYTAGPRPLAYVGLGDLWVFVFFGPVAVAGTVYVQSGAWEPKAVAWGIPVGLLTTAILVVNNLRDIPTDAAAGKRTLAVRMGEPLTRWYYAALLAGAFAVPFLIGHVRQDVTLLIPVAAVAAAAGPVRTVWRRHADRRRLNPALGATARLLVVYGVLAAGALVT